MPLIDPSQVNYHLPTAAFNAPDKLHSILAGFLELGVRGTTVIHSEGMGRVLSPRRGTRTSDS